MDETLNNEVLEELGLLIELLEKKTNEAEDLFRKLKCDTPLESQAFNTLNVYLIRSLRNSLRFTSFLREKVNEDSVNAQFYLAQLRTLAEIIAKVLYLLSLNPIDAARVVACADLLSLKKAEILDDNSFQDSVKHHSHLLHSNHWFPQSPEGFSKGQLIKVQKEKGILLLYPEFKDLFNEEFIGRNTKMANEFSRIDLVKVMKLIWNNFSEHVHGNHLFDIPQGNEVFWINIQNVTLVMYLIEILDSCVLNKERAADTRIRFQETTKLGRKIIQAWQVERNN